MLECLQESARWSECFLLVNFMYGSSNSDYCYINCITVSLPVGIDLNMLWPGTPAKCTNDGAALTALFPLIIMNGLVLKISTYQLCYKVLWFLTI